MVSWKRELPPSIMISPGSRCGRSCSINSSTGFPALTISMTRRGFFSKATISSMEWAPITLVPLASLLRKSSTFETVRLKATTVNPWSFMFKIRFWPITARPIRAMSACGSIFSSISFQTTTCEGRVNLSPASAFSPLDLRQPLCAELEPLIALEQGLQVRPVCFVHVAKGMQIHGDSFAGIFGQQGVNRDAEFGLVHGRWKVFNDAFFVRDLEGVKEINQHTVVFLQQPGADQIAGKQVKRGLAQNSEHGGMLLGAGLALEKDGPEFAGFSYCIERCAVERLIRLVRVGEDLGCQGRRHEAEKFVRG